MMHLQFKPTDLYYVTKTLQGESSSPLLFYFFFTSFPIRYGYTLTPDLVHPLDMLGVVVILQQVQHAA